MWGRLGRTLHQRMIEHKCTVRNEDASNDLAVHVSKTHHIISWEEAKVLTKEEHWTKRKIKEALVIREKHNNLNLDHGYQVDVHTHWTIIVLCTLSSCSHRLTLIPCLISILVLPSYLFLCVLKPVY